MINSKKPQAFFLFLCAVLSLLTGCATSSGELSKEEKIGNLYLQSANTDIMSGNFTSALESLQKAEKSIPKSEELWIAFGLSYFAKKDFKRSEQSFQNALKLNPKNNFARNNLGALYSELGKYPQAQRELDIVIKDLAFTDQFKAYYNLGLLHQKQGNYVRAEGYFEHAVKEHPTYCQGWLKLSEIDLQLSKRNEAISNAKKACAGLCYGYTEAHYRLGLLLTQGQDRDQAKEKFEEIMQRFPRSSWAKLSQEKLRQLASKN